MSFENQWATGVCLERWFHKGAVVSGYGGLDLVLIPWGEGGKRGVTVIGCDRDGTPKPGEKPRHHCTIPMKANVMVRSARPDIRSGIPATHEDVWFDPRRDAERFAVKGVVSNLRAIRKGYDFQIVRDDGSYVLCLAFGRAAEAVAALGEGRGIDAFGHRDPRFGNSYVLSNARPLAPAAAPERAARQLGAAPGHRVAVHTFPHLTSDEVYDRVQWDDSIGNGDVLVLPREGIVAIMVDSWPVSVTENLGCFHTLSEGADWSTLKPTAPERHPDVDFHRSYEQANMVCQREGYPRPSDPAAGFRP
jgi:hypothetical protein